MAPKSKPAGKQRSAIADVVAREYTIHLHKRVRNAIPSVVEPAKSRQTERQDSTNQSGLQLHGVTFKKRAPRAVKEIKKFAQLAMVRCPRRARRGTSLTCVVWSRAPAMSDSTPS